MRPISGFLKCNQAFLTTFLVVYSSGLFFFAVYNALMAYLSARTFNNLNGQEYLLKVPFAIFAYALLFKFALKYRPKLTLPCLALLSFVTAGLIVGSQVWPTIGILSLANLVGTILFASALLLIRNRMSTLGLCFTGLFLGDFCGYISLFGGMILGLLQMLVHCYLDPSSCVD